MALVTIPPAVRRRRHTMGVMLSTLFAPGNNGDGHRNRHGDCGFLAEADGQIERKNLQSHLGLFHHLVILEEDGNFLIAVFPDIGGTLAGQFADSPGNR